MKPDILLSSCFRKNDEPVKKFSSFYFTFVLLSLVKSVAFGQNLIRSYDTPVTIGEELLPNAWAGGLNSCQFSRIDINLDGVEDLFVFDRIGNRVSTYINHSLTPGEINYKYTLEYNDAFPANLNNWAFMRDFNCDGKKDIYTNSQSGLNIWRNVSTPENGLAFEIVQTTNFGNLIGASYDFGSSPFSAPVFCIGPDLPSIVDFDADGDMDIFSYTESSSTIYFFKSMQVENGDCDEPAFICANRCYGMFRESAESFDIFLGDDFTCDFNVVNPRSGEGELQRHTGGTLLSIDLDQNGMLDLISGDVTEKYLISLQMENSQDDLDSAAIIHHDFPATFSNTIGVDMLLFPGAFYEDIDNDGIRDLMVSPNAMAQVEDKSSIWLYKNNGLNNLPDFDFIRKNFLQDQMIELGLGAYPVVFDLDHDGLKDIIVANREAFDPGVTYTSKLWYFKNTGTLQVPAFTLMDDNWLDIPSHQWKSVYPAFGDIDGDDDDDLLLGDLDGFIHVFLNTAGPEAPAIFEPQTNPLADNTNAAIDVGQFATPQLVDLNDDGLIDLVSGEKNGNINYYQNIGTSVAPVFQFIEDSIGDMVSTNYLGIFGYSVPHFFKDENGFWNLITGSETGQINHYDQIEGNILGDFHLVTNDYLGINEGERCAVFLADMDDDGVNDLLYGQTGGGLGLYLSGGDIRVEEQRIPNAGLVLYPNPCHEILNIEFTGKISSTGTIHIIDARGKWVKQLSLTSNTKQIDISDLADGLYLMHVRSNEKSFVQRFVVR